jgi:hypothetical protein
VADGYLKENAQLLLRESWKSPDDLAQQIYMIASDEPANSPVSALAPQIAERQIERRIQPPDISRRAVIQQQTPESVVNNTVENQTVEFRREEAPTEFGQAPKRERDLTPPEIKARRESAIPPNPEFTARTQAGNLAEDQAARRRAREEGAAYQRKSRAYPEAPSPSKTYRGAEQFTQSLFANEGPGPVTKRKPFKPYDQIPAKLDFGELDWDWNIGGLGGGEVQQFGRVVHKTPGAIISVQLYPQGPDGAPADIITVRLLQFADEDTVPEGTWIMGIEAVTDPGGHPINIAQIPIWLA